jgi:hypothetical protein
VKPGGTGSPKPVAPVFVGSTGYTRDIPGYSYLFTPFTPIHLPRLRTVKGEGEKAISWRFEDSTKDFKAWEKISVLQLGWNGFPSIGCSNSLTMSGGTPCLGFARSTFLGTISWNPLVEWLQYGPRIDSNQWIEDSLAAGQGHDLGLMQNPVAPSFPTRWHRFRYKVVCPVEVCAQENSIAYICGREMFLRPICICLCHRSKV